MDEKSDPELVRLALAGSREAFGCLVERYHPAASSLAARMVWNAEAARELVQEAFLQVFLSLPKLRQAERFKSWLYGIVINVCRNYLRAQKLALLSLDALSESPGGEERWPDPQALDPQAVSEERELYTLLFTTIQALPAGQREIVLLYYYHHHSLPEIAAQVGISHEAVKVRLHRARRQLRGALLQRYPELSWQIEPEQRRQTMIAVKIADVVVQDNTPIVLLVDETGGKLLPIWIGESEAMSIALGLLQIPTKRPMTYNFMAQMIAALGARLEEVRVEALKEDVFYGTARLRRNGSTQEVDARPSDVLALALRTGSPIYAGEEVMEAAGLDIRGKVAPESLAGQGAAGLVEKFQEAWKKFQARPEQSHAEQCQALLDFLASRIV